MKLMLVRLHPEEETTIGSLFIEDEFECYTLEDKDRGLTSNMSEATIAEVKVPHKTAIPLGKYEILLGMSKRFGIETPRLQNVPGFTGILIHPGNTAEDTSGCILVGTLRGKKEVLCSQTAFKNLMAKLKEAVNRGDKITINIIEG